MNITMHTGPAPTHYAAMGVWFQRRSGSLRETARQCSMAGREDIAADYRRMAEESMRAARVNFRRAHRSAQGARYAGTVY